MIKVEQLSGTWHGLSQLHLSWAPGDDKVFESESSLVIHAVSDNPVIDSAYTWAHEGQHHVGRHMIVHSGERVEAAWTDTWHMAGALMYCVGSLTPTGMVFSGQYAGGDEMWGWRTEFKLLTVNVMEMHMTNISPAGEEEWAVKAAYSMVS